LPGGNLNVRADSPCKAPPPIFLGLSCEHPWALAQDNMVYTPATACSGSHHNGTHSANVINTYNYCLVSTGTSFLVEVSRLYFSVSLQGVWKIWSGDETIIYCTANEVHCWVT